MIGRAIEIELVGNEQWRAMIQEEPLIYHFKINNNLANASKYFYIFPIRYTIIYQLMIYYDHKDISNIILDRQGEQLHIRISVFLLQFQMRFRYKLCLLYMSKPQAIH